MPFTVCCFVFSLRFTIVGMSNALFGPKEESGEVARAVRRVRCRGAGPLICVASWS